MTASASITPPLDLDGFLDWEQRQEGRFELVGGAVHCMAGGTEGHDRIGLDIAASLRAQLRGSPCSTHESNLRVASRAAGAVMYPDVVVRCGARQDGPAVCDDPVVVEEVLPDATARRDLTRKRLAYEAIFALRRILQELSAAMGKSMAGAAQGAVRRRSVASRSACRKGFCKVGTPA